MGWGWNSSKWSRRSHTSTSYVNHYRGRYHSYWHHKHYRHWNASNCPWSHQPYLVFRPLCCWWLTPCIPYCRISFSSASLLFHPICSSQHHIHLLHIFHWSTLAFSLRGVILHLLPCHCMVIASPYKLDWRCCSLHSSSRISHVYPPPSLVLPSPATSPSSLLYTSSLHSTHQLLPRIISQSSFNYTFST